MWIKKPLPITSARQFGVTGRVSFFPLKIVVGMLIMKFFCQLVLMRSSRIARCYGTRLSGARNAKIAKFKRSLSLLFLMIRKSPLKIVRLESPTSFLRIPTDVANFSAWVAICSQLEVYVLA